MDANERTLTAAGELRALAHPVRLRLMQELYELGTATASELSGRLNESQANCSWHLRQLAKFGFVESVPDSRNARRHPYRPTIDRLTWGSSGDTTDAAVAGHELSVSVLEEQLAGLRSWLVWRGTDPEDWRAAADITHGTLWLTSAELADLNREFALLLGPYLDRMRDPATRPESARRVRVLIWAVPANRFV